VRVRVPRAYAGMIAARAEPGTRQSTLVSVAHQIALAALRPEQLYDVDRSAAKPDTDVSQLAAKVEVIADARNWLSVCQDALIDNAGCQRLATAWRNPDGGI